MRITPSFLDVPQVNAGASWYQVERATHIDPFSDWTPIGGHVPWNTPFYTDTFLATANPTTYLYRVRIGVTSGGLDVTSAPSALDYATVATTLFSDEPLVAGTAPIKGIHISELRHAIDAVRHAANLTPAWNSYAPATGRVTAADNTTARQQLDQAVIALIGHGLVYTGETPATNGRIWKIQLQQIRDGVR